MPQPGERLPEELLFVPWRHGDPAPPLYELARELLDPGEQRQFLGVLIRAQIAMSEARLEGLRQMQNIVGKAAGG